MRPSERKIGELRKVTFETAINRYAEGSCLISWGETKVHCTASVEEKVPPFIKGTGQGWITAEYGMLPRSTHSRSDREAAKGKQSGRTQEIQRLIGRALRAVVDLKGLGERQITLDCDVLQADGGTRCASITGSYVALYLALERIADMGAFKTIPIIGQVAAVSCGITNGEAVLDLDYLEDSKAEADMNFVLTGTGGIIEIQGTAEKQAFSEDQFQGMFSLAKQGISELTAMQNLAIGIIKKAA